MTKFGQAEYNNYIAKMFVNKLDKILETSEKQDFSNRNTEDIYREFSSIKDAAQEDKMLGFIIGLMVGGTTGVLAMCLCTAAFEADRCMNITNSDE